LFVNVYSLDDQLLVILRYQLYPVSFATTLPLVRVPDAGIYSIVAVGMLVSDTYIVLVVVPVFQAVSQ
jgi:hypothetical protein